MSKPDFLIVGTQRGGTTTLRKALAQHPDIAIADVEGHFFNTPKYTVKGIEFYENEILPTGKTVGECTPYYLFHPCVPKRVHAHYPDAKIIMLLRHPSERAYSHYWHSVRNGWENLGFDHALASEEGRIYGAEEHMKVMPNYSNFSHAHHSYVSRGRYDTQIRRWLKYFPLEQIFWTYSECLYYYQKETVERVLAFLDTDTGFLPQIQMWRMNKGEYPPMEDATRARLKATFKPTIINMFDVLPNWDIWLRWTV